MKKSLLIIMAVGHFTTACSSMGKSIFLGSAVAGSAGAAIGHNHGKRSDKKRTTGALIGASLGGLIGYLSYKNKVKKDSKKTAKKVEEAVPLLSRPPYVRIDVD